ncbi:MAG: hypothetical protein RLZZ480_67, partial [Candidatus Parcubacteria bacterium]
MKRLYYHQQWLFVKAVTLFLFLAVGLLAVPFFPPKFVEAAPSYTINYQGKLTTNTGVAVTNGTYQMVFKLYTQSSGGAAIWTETR